MSQDRSSSIFNASQVEIFILMIFVLLVITQIMTENEKNYDKGTINLAKDNADLKKDNAVFTDKPGGDAIPICKDQGKGNNVALFHIERTPAGYKIIKNIDGPITIDKNFMPNGIILIKENGFRKWADEFYKSVKIPLGTCKFIYKRVVNQNAGWEDVLNKKQLAQLPKRFEKMEDIIEGYFYRQSGDITIQ